MTECDPTWAVMPVPEMLTWTADYAASLETLRMPPAYPADSGTKINGNGYRLRGHERNVGAAADAIAAARNRHRGNVHDSQRRCWSG